MSINNPEQRQNTTNPDIADSTHDLKALHAQPAVVPPREHRDERMGWKKPAAVVALLGAGAAAAFGITKAVGDHESANHVPERSPSTSAPANPAETNPNVLKLPKGVATMFAETDPGQQQAAFDQAMSPILTKRVDSGDLYGADNSDLIGITGGVDLPALDEFAHFTASGLKTAREKLSAKLGPDYASSGVALKSTVESSQTNPDGTISDVADIKFWLLDKDGVPVGDLMANSEKYSFTYKDAPVLQSDGTVKTIAILTQFEHILNTGE